MQLEGAIQGGARHALPAGAQAVPGDRRLPSALWTVALVCLVVLAGCVRSFDPTGYPCDPAAVDPCLAGFQCIDGLCVAPTDAVTPSEDSGSNADTTDDGDSAGIEDVSGPDGEDAAPDTAQPDATQDAQVDEDPLAGADADGVSTLDDIQDGAGPAAPDGVDLPDDVEDAGPAEVLVPGPDAEPTPDVAVDLDAAPVDALETDAVEPSPDGGEPVDTLLDDTVLDDTLLEDTVLEEVTEPLPDVTDATSEPDGVPDVLQPADDVTDAAAADVEGPTADVVPDVELPPEAPDCEGWFVKSHPTGQATVYGAGFTPTGELLAHGRIDGEFAWLGHYDTAGDAVHTGALQPPRAGVVRAVTESDQGLWVVAEFWDGFELNLWFRLVTPDGLLVEEGKTLVLQGVESLSSILRSGNGWVVVTNLDGFDDVTGEDTDEFGFRVRGVSNEGDVLWQRDTPLLDGVSLRSAVMSDGDLLLIDSGCGTWRLTAGGSERWFDTLGDGCNNIQRLTALPDGGALAVGAASNNAPTLFRLGVGPGVVWSQPLPFLQFGFAARHVPALPGGGGAGIVVAGRDAGNSARLIGTTAVGEDVWSATALGQEQGLSGGFSFMAMDIADSREIRFAMTAGWDPSGLVVARLSPWGEASCEAAGQCADEAPGSCALGGAGDCAGSYCHPLAGCIETQVETCVHAPSCSLGACNGGTCAADGALLCGEAPECHTSGGCAGDDGLCSPVPHVDGAPCDDEAPCTTSETCVSGSCVVQSVVECLGATGPCDGNVCTDGACVSVWLPDGTACDDASACTEETGACLAGACDAEPVDCDDEDPCTADSCDPGSGCLNDYQPDCDVDGQCFFEGDVVTGCLTCQPDVSDSAGSPDPATCAHLPCLPAPTCGADGSCGGDVAAGWCFIGGACVEAGSVAPSGCEQCDPANPDEWTSLPDDTPCGGACPGGACQAGACVATNDDRAFTRVYEEISNSLLSAAVVVPDLGPQAVVAVGHREGPEGGQTQCAWAVRTGEGGVIEQEHILCAGADNDTLRDLIRLQDGSFAAMGFGVNVGQQPWLQRFDASFEPQDPIFLSLDHNNTSKVGFRLAELPDGTLVASLEEQTDPYPPLLVWLTPDGEVIGIATHEVPGAGLLATGDGSVLAFDLSTGSPQMARFGARGQREWSGPLDFGGSFYPAGLALPDGGVIIAGASANHLTRLRHDGSIGWQRTGASSPQRQVARRADGGLVTAGYTVTGATSTLWWRGYTAVGEPLWQRDGSVEMANTLWVSDLEVAPHGDLVTVGQKGNPSRAFLVWTDAWGHDQCAAAGACADVAYGDCPAGDARSCEAAFCDPASGCAAQVDAAEHCVTADGVMGTCGADGTCVADAADSLCDPIGSCREGDTVDGGAVCEWAPTDEGDACDDQHACTAASTCQGGRCVADALCEDGDLCTLEDTCFAEVCRPGEVMSCGEPDDPCNTWSCEVGQCLADPTGAPGCGDPPCVVLLGGWCVIDGQCVEEGTVNPDDPCEECNDSNDADWSPRAEGTACGVTECQRLTCDAAGTCGPDVSGPRWWFQQLPSGGRAHDIREMPDGGVLVAGSGWVARYGVDLQEIASGSWEAAIFAAVPQPDGTVQVAGYGAGESFDVIKVGVLDADLQPVGEPLIFDTGHFQIARDAEDAGEGRLVVLSEGFSEQGVDDAGRLRMVQDGTSVVWDIEVFPPQANWDVSRLTVLSDGDIVAAADYPCTVVRVDPEGNIRFSKTLGSGCSDVLGVGALHDGGFVVSGNHSGFPHQWRFGYGSSEALQVGLPGDAFFDVASMPGGGLVWGGEHLTGAPGIVGTTAFGHFLWDALETGAATGRVHRVRATADGDVLVAGWYGGGTPAFIARLSPWGQDCGSAGVCAGLQPGDCAIGPASECAPMVCVPESGCEAVSAPAKCLGASCSIGTCEADGLCYVGSEPLCPEAPEGSVTAGCSASAECLYLAE